MAIPTSGKMEIVIQMPSETGKSTNDTPSPASPQSIENDNGNPTNPKDNDQFKLSMAVQAAKNIGMQALKAGIGNIGLATGNYYEQQKAERTVNATQSIIALAMSFNNPVTGMVALAGMAISAGSEYYQQTKEREIANYEAEQMAKRLGYTRDRR